MAAPLPVPRRAILALSDGGERFTETLALAEQLVRGKHPHELVLAQLLDPDESDRLLDVAASLGQRRQELEAQGGTARVAAFTSSAFVEDVVRLASRSEIDLLLTPGPPEILRDGEIDDALTSLLRQVLCDVAFLVQSTLEGSPVRDGPVLVPFGAGEHDWAAARAWRLAGRSEWPRASSDRHHRARPNLASATLVGCSPMRGCSSSGRQAWRLSHGSSRRDTKGRSRRRAMVGCS